MTAQEVLLWVRKQPFRPFRVTMNNRRIIDIVHPELAEVSAAGALYVHEPADEGISGLVACDIRNICTLDLLQRDAPDVAE